MAALVWWISEHLGGGHVESLGHGWINRAGCLWRRSLTGKVVARIRADKGLGDTYAGAGEDAVVNAPGLQVIKMTYTLHMDDADAGCACVCRLSRYVSELPTAQQVQIALFMATYAVDIIDIIKDMVLCPAWRACCVLVTYFGDVFTAAVHRAVLGGRGIAE